ncbi:MAG TPA: 4a-hydroxytetrahydrobiopterin dehydratase [Nevskiales bacterium]|nr:4a-hydroxytetrahydrobiopterin dehydratase [Nevskiales bacterium]
MESALVTRRCKPCEGGVPALSQAEARALLAQIGPHWKLAADAKSIEAQFNFRNYWQTTAFVNAVAWIAHQEDHHPDISFGYKTCTIRYSTHAIGGLSENDFICAAKVDALLGKPE